LLRHKLHALASTSIAILRTMSPFGPFS